MTHAALVAHSLPTFVTVAGVRVDQAETVGALLLANTVYFAELGASAGGVPRLSPHFLWDSALIASITFEMSNFHDIAANVATGVATGWEAVPAGAAATITIAGGTAAGAIQQWYEMLAHRVRARVAVGATGGRLRLAVAAKG